MTAPIFIRDPRSVALVLPGEAMWGAFQTGFARELGGRLCMAGGANQPFRVTIGSSSGSLIAAAAAAGGPFDHENSRAAWIEFGQATKFRLQRPFNPYPGALQRIFEGGSVDIEKAFHSSTDLIVTASHYRGSAASDLRQDHARLLSAGLHLFFAGMNSEDAAKISEIGADLLSDGLRMFGTRYFATCPPPGEASATSQDEEWVVVQSSPELRRAVEASSRVPLLYGNPVLDGANVLIDGVFTNNAPVELALQYGVRDVFVVTSSKKGYVFDRPVQTLVRRQIRSLLKNFSRASRGLSFLPDWMHVKRELAELGRLASVVPPPRPLDIDDLRRRYPDQHIHIVHPQENISVNRFFESSPAVLGRLYDLGREEASQVQVQGTH